MDLKIRFDHASHLSLTDLQSRGIRSTNMLEEVFLDNDSTPVEITTPEDEFPVFFVVGFSKPMLPLLYIFEIPDTHSLDLLIVSRYVRIAIKEELRKYFCK